MIYKNFLFEILIMLLVFHVSQSSNTETKTMKDLYETEDKLIDLFKNAVANCRSILYSNRLSKTKLITLVESTNKIIIEINQMNHPSAMKVCEILKSFLNEAISFIVQKPKKLRILSSFF